MTENPNNEVHLMPGEEQQWVIPSIAKIGVLLQFTRMDMNGQVSYNYTVDKYELLKLKYAIEMVGLNSYSFNEDIFVIGEDNQKERMNLSLTRFENKPSLALAVENTEYYTKIPQGGYFDLFNGIVTEAINQQFNNLAL